MNNGTLAQFSLSAAMLVTLLGGCGGQESVDGDAGLADSQPVVEEGMASKVSGSSPQDSAQEALRGLWQIRQEQCQSGNQLACQSLNEFSVHSQHLTQWLQACRSGDSQACGSYKNLAEKIFFAYSESAAVMRQGEEAMARMNAWRAQMNRNADASLANLRAQGAAGQAAHDARQQSNEALNGAWQSGQIGGDIAQQQRVDQIYEQERCVDGRIVSIHVGC